MNLGFLSRQREREREIYTVLFLVVVNIAKNCAFHGNAWPKSHSYCPVAPFNPLLLLECVQYKKYTCWAHISHIFQYIPAIPQQKLKISQVYNNSRKMTASILLFSATGNYKYWPQFPIICALIKSVQCPWTMVRIPDWWIAWGLA